MDELRTRYSVMRHLGRCVSCGKHAEPGRCMCAECTEQTRKKQAELKKYRHENGLCRDCGRPAVPGHSMCAEHLIRHRIYSKKAKRRMKERRMHDEH